MSLKQAEADMHRIRPEDIDAAIMAVNYLNAHDAVRYVNANNPKQPFCPWQLNVMTIALVTMTNGFVVVGTSACAHPDNYDRALGEKFALEDAKRKIWPLLGFALRDRLNRTGQTIGAQAAEIAARDLADHWNNAGNSSLAPSMEEIRDAINKERANYKDILDLDRKDMLVSFSVALDHVKKGFRAQRQGWNGKGMWIAMIHSGECKPGSVPMADRNRAVSDYVHDHGPAQITAYLVMKAADGSIVPGWLASQTDMLAEDWLLLT